MLGLSQERERVAADPWWIKDERYARLRHQIKRVKTDHKIVSYTDLDLGIYDFCDRGQW